MNTLKEWVLGNHQLELPLGRSLGGPADEHYASLGDPQPLEVIEAWRLPHHLACVLKYIARWNQKGGVEDLEKAQFYLRRFIYLKRAE
jgi:hypothetical protein